jgi:hypothetical protein
LRVPRKVIKDSVAFEIALLSESVDSVTAGVVNTNQFPTGKFVETVVNGSIKRAVVIRLKVEMRAIEKVSCLSIKQEEQLLDLHRRKTSHFRPRQLTLPAISHFGSYSAP